MKKYFFRSQTQNNRFAKTTILGTHSKFIVIQQRVLAHIDDINNGWFSIYKVIYSYGEWRLMLNEMVLWNESFEKVCQCVDKIKESRNEK